MADNKATKKNNIEIPQKLLDLIKAEDTALEIARICFENEIKEDAKIRGISYQTGRVLVGDSPLKDFEKALEEKIALSPFVASKIAREINESLFESVKESLSELYETEALERPAITPATRVKEDKSKGPDTYREPVE
jgi:hypothetical protein